MLSRIRMQQARLGPNSPFSLDRSSGKQTTLIVFDSYKWKPRPSNPSSFLPIPPLGLLPPPQPHSPHQPAHGARVGATLPLIAAPSLSSPPPPTHGVVQGGCRPSCLCRASLHPLRVRQIHTSHRLPPGLRLHLDMYIIGVEHPGE
jgi:hypothetical protein